VKRGKTIIIDFRSSTLGSASLALLLAFPFNAVAQACPVNEYSVCLGDTCVCIPPLSGDLETMAAEAIKTIEEARAPVLEAWLRESRNDSYLASAPIPPPIRQALEGYIADEVLDNARFLVADPSTISSTSLNLGSMAIAYGDLVNGTGVEAITLIDVIIFRNEVDALNNPALWAHELTHVKQFMTWGVRDFADAYVNDSARVEAEASKVGDGYSAFAGK
jgi:hypothetical protein